MAGRRPTGMASTRTRKAGPQSTHPHRGEIYLTALDPSLGREIQQTRPALVIQNDVSNRVSDGTIVAPITSTVRFPLNPVHVLLAADEKTGLSVTSAALLNQIRAVDRSRLVKRLGAIDARTLSQIDEAIRISLGLVAL
jgi:mRNA interferase MazF